MFYHPATQRRIASGSAFELDGMQFPQNWLNLSDIQDKLAHGIYDLVQQPQPTFNPITQICVDGGVVNLEGTWTAAWSVLDLPEEAIANNIANATKQVQESVVVATQARLDDFAKTRNYDGILSACTYAGSLIPTFKADGLYCCTARDATWATLYEFMAEVQAGTKPMPTGFASVEPLLPVLSWPV